MKPQNEISNSEDIIEYDQQAADFLAKFGLKFRATLSDSKPAPWGDNGGYRPHYRVTISKGKPCSADFTGNIRSASRLTFDFWDSVNAGQTGEPLTAYSALACISADIYTPETFAEFCADFGENEDSRKAMQLFRRCDRFARRLRAFFTAEEAEALSEIR